MLTGWRASLLRHPWSAALLFRRPLIGPNSLAWMEFLQPTLTRAGLAGPALTAATWTLHNHVLSSAASQSNLQLFEEERRTGQQTLDDHRDQYPNLVAHGYLLDDDWDGGFTLGLGYLLDGIDAQLGAQGRGPG